MKIKGTIIMIILMMVCFFLSGLFFLNSGIFNANGELDEVRAVEITRELNKIPLVNYDDMTFHVSGTVIAIGEDSIVIREYHGKEFVFNYDPVGLRVGDKARIYYQYSETYEKEVIEVQDIGRLK